MAAKLTRPTYKIAIQLRLVAESCTICSSRSRRSVRKLLDIPSYMERERRLSASHSNDGQVSECCQYAQQDVQRCGARNSVGCETPVLRSQSSSVSIVTRLRAGRLGSTPAGEMMDFFLFAPPFPDRLWGPSDLLPNGYRRLYTKGRTARA
jgi:hypothetical protein